jgi:O-antigen ligase
MGAMAVPGLLALLTVGRLRRRWIAMVLCAGALLGIAAAASRSSLIIGVVALLSYAGLSVIAHLKVGRLLAGVLVALGLAYGVASAFISYSGKNSLHRQETIASSLEGNGGGRAGKERNLLQLPGDVAGAPFGSGLGTGGSAGGLGGKQKVTIEGRGVSREGALNLLVIETGAPGMLLWIGLSLNVMALACLRLRRIVDPELRTYLVAVMAAFVAFTAEGFAGPTLAGTPAGVYLWFAAGIAAYWFAGPGYKRSRRTTHASAL